MISKYHIIIIYALIELYHICMVLKSQHFSKLNKKISKNFLSRELKYDFQILLPLFSFEKKKNFSY